MKELGLDPGTETLQRWMAHYLAELIVVADSAEEKEKLNAQQDCYETILALWEQRQSLPDGSRPFEKFEGIWKTLERLDPLNAHPFYTTVNSYSAPTQENDPMDMWLDLASKVDFAARTLIDYSLRQAASTAFDDDAKKWFDTVQGLDGSSQTHVINLMIVSASKDEDENKKIETENEIKKLKKHKENLQSLLSISEKALGLIDEQILQLQKTI